MASSFRCFLWLYFLLLSLYLSQISRAEDIVEEGILYINGFSSIAKIDDDFICATLDWWPSSKCDYGTCSWGNSSLLNLDLSNKVFLNAIRAFSPLIIRLGGTLQDKLIYQTTHDKQPCTPFLRDATEIFGFTQGCLPLSRWDELNEVFKKTGAKVTFGLNALNGKTIVPDGSTSLGDWDSSNAESLIRYTVSRGYTILGWELGNELNGNGIGPAISADQYASDVKALHQLVEDIYKGKDVMPLILAPGGIFDAVWFPKFIDKASNYLQVVTHHIYSVGGGNDPNLVQKILEPSHLDEESKYLQNLQGILRNSGTSTVAWVGESGGVYNSGRDHVSNSFVSSFWYLDQLGMSATFDTKKYCRQTLVGGNYGLLNTTNFHPNPDYYGALLWHRLMGRNVLSTHFQGTEKLRSYAHCSKSSEIDMTVPSLENIYCVNENCKAPLRNYLVKMMEEEGDQLACIVYDNIMFFVDDVATQLRLPSIVLRTFSAAYIHSMITILQKPEKYFPFEDSQLLDPLPELHPLRFKDVPIPAVNNTVPEPVLDFCRTICDIGSSVATIWNTMQDLESSWLLRLQEHYKVPFFPIGPFHKMAHMASSTSILEEDNSCIEWLNRQAPNSVLYVSIGSLVSIDEKELIETAWGLANSEQPFLWVIRSGSVSGFQCAEALPDGFEEMVGERGRIVKWAPQKQVLAHPAVAGFFTHCGWNSTLESILEEVPMICRPFFVDQLVNARYLSQIYKVGFELEVMERTVMEKTIRKLMLSEEGKDVKKRVVEMKQNIVAGMQVDGTSHKNLNDLVDFISALPSRLAPPTPVVGAIMNSNHTTRKCIIES